MLAEIMMVRRFRINCFRLSNYPENSPVPRIYFTRKRNLYRRLQMLLLPSGISFHCHNVEVVLTAVAARNCQNEFTVTEFVHFVQHEDQYLRIDFVRFVQHEDNWPSIVGETREKGFGWNAASSANIQNARVFVRLRTISTPPR